VLKGRRVVPRCASRRAVVPIASLTSSTCRLPTRILRGRRISISCGSGLPPRGPMRPVSAGAKQSFVPRRARRRYSSCSARPPHKPPSRPPVRRIDGWVRVVIPIESVDQAAADLMRLGAEAEVLKPMKLRRRIASRRRPKATCAASCSRKAPAWSRL
jgi:hypothetical protein